MKVIDLLNKIANGEEVQKRICYKQYVYIFDKSLNNYSRSWEYGDSTTRVCLMTEISNLNDEVEIIEDTEEKQIEKLRNSHKWGDELTHKINELVDKINKIS